jgi:hypothetical protein
MGEGGMALMAEAMGESSANHRPEKSGSAMPSALNGRETQRSYYESLRGGRVGLAWPTIPRIRDIAAIHGRDAMKLPRFSIAWIMAIIVIAAIDFAIIRALDGTNTVIGALLVFGSMPMASILVLGIPSLVRGFTGRGKIRPFLAGFEGVGWTILLVYTGSASLFPESVAGAIDLSSQFLMSLIGLDTADGPDPDRQLFGLFVVVLILLLPQLFVALVGGWLNQRFKIRITIERRHATGLETMMPSSVAGTVSPGRVDS